MRTRSLTRTARWAAVFTLAASAPIALAQQPVEPVLLIEHGPASTWVRSPHDAGLARAASMIPARISELPREIDDLDAETAGLLRFGLELLAQRGTITITYNPGDPSGGAFGYGIALEKHITGPEQAAALDALAQRALAQAPPGLPVVPSQRFPGLTEIQTPAMLVSYGPAQTEQGPVYRLLAGSVSDPAAGRAMLPTPFVEGVDPVFRGTLNLAALTPGLRMAQTMAGPRAQGAGPFIAKLTEAGLVGENAMRLDFWGGYTADGALSGGTLRNARALWTFLDLPESPLTPADFAAVPAGAGMASLVRADLDMVGALLDHAADLGAPVEQTLGRLKDEAGIDLRGDLIQALGGTLGFYTDAASGSPFIALVSIRDHAALDRLERSLAQLAVRARDGLGMPGAYIRMDSWEFQGRALRTLRFPGLPVPVEITYARVGDWMVLAPTVQGALYGARQAAGENGPGLLENASLKAHMPGRTDLLSLSFYDSPERLKDGYTIVSLVGAALGNAVRSPFGDDRDPGLVVPPLADLAEGARPIVQYSYLQGDDFVMLGHGDQSLLVNIMGQTAGAFGGLGAQVGPFLNLINNR